MFTHVLMASREEGNTDVSAQIKKYLTLFKTACSEGISGQGSSLSASAASSLVDNVYHKLLAVVEAEFNDCPALQLTFTHDCRAIGCSKAQQCCLCEHNPKRRCGFSLQPKYYVKDLLRAACGAPVSIQLCDGQGRHVEMDLTVEVFVVDGASYDKDSSPDFDGSCILARNKKQEPLLQGQCVSETSGKLIINLEAGRGVVPDVYVSDSSEALLGSGRKPYFRLVAQCSGRDSCEETRIIHGASDTFVVVTRRSRSDAKVETPSLSDPVSKLEHIGKETVRKLHDLTRAAGEAQIEVGTVDLTSIRTVGDFKSLLNRLDNDGLLRHKVQQLLGFSKEKWREVCLQVRSAVAPDSRMRLWTQDNDWGVVFSCIHGAVQLNNTPGLVRLQGESAPGSPVHSSPSREAAPTTPVIGGSSIHLLPASLLSAEQAAMRDQLQAQAVEAWWQPGHPGWSITQLESQLCDQVASKPASRAASLSGAAALCSLNEAPSISATHNPASPAHPAARPAPTRSSSSGASASGITSATTTTAPSTPSFSAAPAPTPFSTLPPAAMVLDFPSFCNLPPAAAPSLPGSFTSSNSSRILGLPPLGSTRTSGASLDHHASNYLAAATRVVADYGMPLTGSGSTPAMGSMGSFTGTNSTQLPGNWSFPLSRPSQMTHRQANEDADMPMHKSTSATLPSGASLSMTHPLNSFTSASSYCPAPCPRAPHSLDGSGSAAQGSSHHAAAMPSARSRRTSHDSAVMEGLSLGSGRARRTSDHMDEDDPVSARERAFMEPPLKLAASSQQLSSDSLALLDVPYQPRRSSLTGFLMHHHSNQGAVYHVPCTGGQAMITNLMMDSSSCEEELMELQQLHCEYNQPHGQSQGMMGGLGLAQCSPDTEFTLDNIPD